MRELRVLTADDMEALGASLAPFLAAGDVIRLDGELGAGKTTFTRGLGAGLGTREAVTSPTFVLARVHPTQAGAPLLHVDAYRLTSAAELDDLDLDFAGSISVVEWGAGRLPEDLDALLIGIERPVGGDPDAEDVPRIVRVAGAGPRGRAIAAAWLAVIPAS